MLRFANWRLASVLALVAAAVLVILPSFMPSQAVDALAARFPSFIPLRQIVLGLDLQGGAYLLMEVDTPSVIKSQVETLRDDVRQKLREGKIGISGGIGVEPRAVVVRIADPAERAKALELLQSLSQPIGGALAGGNGRTLDVTQSRRRRTAGADRRRNRRQGASRGRAIDRSAEPPHQRDGHQGDCHPATGAEPCADRGAGQPGHDGAQEHDRPDRQARVSPGRRSRRSAERVRDAADAEGRRNDPGAEAGHGGRRGPGRRAAELRPAVRRAGRQLPLQPARRAEVWPGHVGQCRPPLRHRARRQGDIGAGHPFADHRRHRPDHRQFQPRRGLEPGDSVARRRAAGQAHRDRGAHGRTRASARTRSTPGNARPMSGRRWSSST